MQHVANRDNNHPLPSEEHGQAVKKWNRQQLRQVAKGTHII